MMFFRKINHAVILFLLALLLLGCTQLPTPSSDSSAGENISPDTAPVNPNSDTLPIEPETGPVTEETNSADSVQDTQINSLPEPEPSAIPNEPSSNPTVSSDTLVSLPDVPSNSATVLFQALAEAGIPDAVVDVQDTKILISFDLPSTMQEKNAAFFALGLAAQVALPLQQLQVEIFQGTSSKIYSVESHFVKEFAVNEITEQELLAVITIT